jgi:hypothetical protein
MKTDSNAENETPLEKFRQCGYHPIAFDAPMMPSWICKVTKQTIIILMKK